MYNKNAKMEDSCKTSQSPAHKNPQSSFPKTSLGKGWQVETYHLSLMQMQVLVWIHMDHLSPPIPFSISKINKLPLLLHNSILIKRGKYVLPDCPRCRNLCPKYAPLHFCKSSTQRCYISHHSVTKWIKLLFVLNEYKQEIKKMGQRSEMWSTYPRIGETFCWCWTFIKASLTTFTSWECYGC